MVWGGVNSVSIDYTLSTLGRQGLQGKIKKQMIMLKQAVNAVKKSSNGDIIITWSHLSGLYVNALLKLTCRKRHIIAFNWLTPLKDGKYKRLQKSLAKNADADIILNSPESREKWENHLGVSFAAKVSVIPDVYDSNEFFEKPEVHERKYCFTGGMNNRNWKIVVELADFFMNVEFICVALKDDFERQVETIPSNMHVFFDIPAEQYYELMRGAYLVLLPLRDNRVSGLINIIKSAQYGVPCMSSSTPATKQYYCDETEKLLVQNDFENWKEQVSVWLSYSEKEYCEKTEKFCSYIEHEFSPCNAAKKIKKLMDDYGC